jgi:parvulin-like peptidyl-prolyl isomerase
MNSQTMRRPAPKKAGRSNKPKRYNKQTARFEGKRDGKPLIFGWGGHLSHSQKEQLRVRTIWTTAIIFAVLIVVVVAGFWININVITPGLPITSVNGHNIPQSLYRKMVALQAQQADNQINGSHGLIAQRDAYKKQADAEQITVNATTSEINKLVADIKALKPSQTAQKTSLNKQLTTERALYQKQQNQLDTLNSNYNNYNTNVVPLAQQNYTQSQIGNISVQWLQNDELIREWLATQPISVQNKVNPTQSQVTQAMNSFKATLPTGTTYGAFLSKDGVSDGDIVAMMTVSVRRANMQNYLASQIKSPAYQVLARQMVIDTKPHAETYLKQLEKGSDFGALAKAHSSDANTNSQGGYLGWMARGQYAQQYSSAIVENWMFDPARYLNEISPIINQNGTYIIVQILGTDPSRTIDSSTLKTLKSNALSDWLLEVQALPTTNIGLVNQTMLLDTGNMPPDLPSAAPASSVPGAPSQAAP